eukprot:SAG31_NODE_2469_length_5650_cov_2.117636_7_plen_109_part_00
MADGETVGRKRKSSSGSARQEEKKSARAKNADNAMDAIAEEDGLPAKYHLVLRDLRDDTDDCSVKISKVRRACCKGAEIVLLGQFPREPRTECFHSGAFVGCPLHRGP